MKIPIYQIDAFTEAPFGGNPAAVCPLEEWPADELLQRIAMENNLSETAFFVPENDGYRLRWFTPVAEVDLCGHATLATAFVLFEELGFNEPVISFFTKSGLLKVRKAENGFMMDFPAVEPVREEGPPILYQALGIPADSETYRSDDYMVILENEKQVGDLDPDFRLLREVNARGVIVSAPGNEVDFVSRFFAPRHAIDEDPVTGSAHTKLAPYWSQVLGKTEMDAVQLSARRGKLKVRLNAPRVEISGTAVRFMKGEITL